MCALLIQNSYYSTSIFCVYLVCTIFYSFIVFNKCVALLKQMVFKSIQKYSEVPVLLSLSLRYGAETITIIDSNIDLTIIIITVKGMQ